jgi:ElaB/YqjD/DUF883 family membrane-anchored ribosome-binding protein
VTYNTSDPDTIERELAETRARLDVRLEELERRLSPGQLVDSGLDYLRHGQGAAFARNLGAEVRDNPLPVAVTGIGLAWLMGASALSRDRHNDASRMPDRYGQTAEEFYDDVGARAQHAGDLLTQFGDENEEAFKTRVVEARAQILGVQREASETASAFVDRVQQALATAQQNAQDRMEQMRQTGGQWGSSVADQTRRTGQAMGQAAQQGREMASRAGNAIAETVDQNPLVLGALGLAAGVLLGAMMPATEQEEALVAPVGGSIRRAADQAVDRGKRAAEAAAEAAYDEIAEPR